MFQGLPGLQEFQGHMEPGRRTGDAPMGLRHRLTGYCGRRIGSSRSRSGGELSEGTGNLGEAHAASTRRLLPNQPAKDGRHATLFQCVR